MRSNPAFASDDPDDVRRLIRDNPWAVLISDGDGVPEILDAGENLAVLTRLVDHFEREVEQPLELDQEQGAKIARGTIGIRMPVSRFVCKRKLSQNKDEAARRQVIEALRRPGPYEQPELADEMEQA